MENKTFAQQFTTMRFIHISMVFATIIYGIIFWIIDHYAPLVPTIEDVSLMKILQIAILIYFVLLVFIVVRLKKHLFSSAEINFLTNTPQLQNRDKPPYYAKYMTILFVLWSIIESLAIFGVVYYILFVDLKYALLIIALSAMLMLYHRPRRDELETLAASYRKDDILSEYEKL
ncbi:MAG: hypothetical protein JXQ68_05700 [Campylobacterales bacterium]|nr:hypothetical protein [Campylobacterales bacterium]